MKKRFIISSLVLVLGVFATSLVLPSSAYAEEAVTKPDIWLQMSPTQERLTLNPGDAYSSKLKVKNIGAKEFKVKIYASPFSVVGSAYEYNYEAETKYNQIARWVTFDKTDYTIPVGDEQEVTFHINVPSDVAGGSQHAVIFAESESIDTDTEGIKAVSRVGMRLITKITGDTREDVSLADYSVQSLYVSFTGPKINASSLIKNTGNTDIEARYNFSVKPFFGGDPVYTEDKTQLILPDTEYEREVTWGSTPLLGLFNVTYAVTAGSIIKDGKYVVLVIPAWLVIILLILLTFLVIWITLSIRRRRQLRSKVKF